MAPKDAEHHAGLQTFHRDKPLPAVSILPHLPHCLNPPAVPHFCIMQSDIAISLILVLKINKKKYFS
ncbi:hypothetical protein XENTR_v10003701 [Xenopus tropicalis]|nr:hypothetical protein XENTR_v10003701 [Xenopus tropicalis]